MSRLRFRRKSDARVAIRFTVCHTVNVTETLTFNFPAPSGPAQPAPVGPTAKAEFTDSQGYFDADAAAYAAYWSGQAAAAKQQEEGRKRLLALKGQTVTVVKGRKVPIGTTGRVFWSGEGRYGWRVGFETADGETFWTAASNVCRRGGVMTARTATVAVSPASHQRGTQHPRRHAQERRLRPGLQRPLDPVGEPVVRHRRRGALLIEVLQAMRRRAGVRPDHAGGGPAMKLHGWCEKCRKIKRVRVSGAGMARLGRGVATGICDACQQAADDARRLPPPSGEYPPVKFYGGDPHTRPGRWTGNP